MVGLNSGDRTSSLQFIHFNAPHPHPPTRPHTCLNLPLKMNTPLLIGLKFLNTPK